MTDQNLNHIAGHEKAGQENEMQDRKMQRQELGPIYTCYGFKAINYLCQLVTILRTNFAPK